MPRLIFGWTITLAAVMLSQSVASAQGISSSGLFGSRNVGSGGIQAGSRSTFGGGNTPLNGAPGSRIEQISTSTDLTGSERFLRGSRTAADFVGADVADTAFIGALPASPTGSTGNFSSGGLGTGGLGTGGLGTGGFGGTGFGSGGFGGNRNNGTSRNQTNLNSSNRQINFQTKLQIGFEHPTISRPTIRTNLESRLNSVRLRRVTPLTVEMNGQTAILRGQVARESDRVVAVRIAKLEPGIESVIDQLTVGTTVSDASKRSPSN